MSQTTFCGLCQPQSLTSNHIQGALYEKYSTSIHFYHLQHAQSLLSDDTTSISIAYRQMNYLADDSECLKRIYSRSEFPTKIEQLADYYKFSRDLPKSHDAQLTRTLERYHDRIRELDFKKVKAAVKKEQGISLTSYHDDSSPLPSNCSLKSKYSSVLHALNEDSKNESNLFNNFCQQVEEAFPQKEIPSSAIKGFFPEVTKKFQQFVEKEERKSKGFCFKKRKLPEKDQTANKENTLKKGINLMRQPSKKSVLKSISEKTRANDTISREEKFKKTQKYFLKTIDCENMLRPSLTINRPKPRNIEQIYKGSQHQQSKYNSLKEKKGPSEGRKKKLINITNSRSQNIKSRSVARNTISHSKQSTYVLDTDRQPHELNKKSLTTTSIRRSLSRFKRQNSVHSQKALPLVSNQNNKYQKTLSRSKSKCKISRQSSRQSVKLKQPVANSTSNFNESISKQRALSRQREERSKLDKLLTKKLALFMKD